MNPSEASQVNLSRVVAAGSFLQLYWSDGAEQSVPAVWLRQSSPAPDACDPLSGQKLFDLALLEEEPGVCAAWLNESGGVDLILSPDGHQTRFEALQLRSWDRPAVGAEEARQPWPERGNDALSTADYAAIFADRRARLAWLQALWRDGAALLSGASAELETGAAVIGLFGQVRETNYGRSFAVVAKPGPNNLAYSSVGLGPHSDNPYRDPVPGLQVLHCLENSASGGDTILVDGIAAAEFLREVAPEDFALLSRIPAHFRFRDRDADLRSASPLIELDAAGALAAVRYNNRSFQGPVLPADISLQYYRAYRRFGQLLNGGGFSHRRRLEPGDILAFDNRRMLHGRTAFMADGRRHLEGWYADHDGLRSAIAVLKRDLGNDA